MGHSLTNLQSEDGGEASRCHLSIKGGDTAPPGGYPHRTPSHSHGIDCYRAVRTTLSLAGTSPGECFFLSFNSVVTWSTHSEKYTGRRLTRVSRSGRRSQSVQISNRVSPTARSPLSWPRPAPAPLIASPHPATVPSPPTPALTSITKD